VIPEVAPVFLVLSLVSLIGNGVVLLCSPDHFYLVHIIIALVPPLALTLALMLAPSLSASLTFSFLRLPLPSLAPALLLF